MGQYKTGTVSVTKDSAVITGVGTKFLTNIAIGQIFSLQGSWVGYEIASITSDTQFTLSTPYAGDDADDQFYLIVNDYTANYNLPLPNYGDVDIAYIFRRAVVKVDEMAAQTLAAAEAAAVSAADSEASAAAVAASTATLVATAGDVKGPATSTDGVFPLFDGTTGKKVKNSTYAPASFAAASHTHPAAQISDATTIGRSLLTAATAAAALALLSAASTSYVDTKVAALVNSAPAALDTLNELSLALGNDANFTTTMTTALAAKLNSASYTAADVLSKLLTVDGAGSGLDADLLDGINSASFVRKDSNNILATGFDASVGEDGTFTSGTYTPGFSGGNFRHVINGGAFTFAAPTTGNQYTLAIYVQNTTGAGAITLSGFTKVTGSAFTTVVGDKFFVFVTKMYGLTFANVVALQ